MKLIIAGGRDFHAGIDEELLKEHYQIGLTELDRVNEKYDITEVVCGKAKGADTFGELWAIDNDIRVTYFPADWVRYKKRAGPIRNEQMGDYADMLVAFWDGKSTGTKHMINYMRKLKKPLVIENYNMEEEDSEW